MHSGCRRTHYFPQGMNVRSLFFLLAVTLLSAIDVGAERLPVKTYTVADGALRDEANRIEFDSHGFLWVCSSEGLSRFDGYTFTNFTTLDGLPDRHVNDFLETKNGDYWIATDAGLVRLNPRGIPGSNEAPLFTLIDAPHAVPIAVKTLYEDSDHKLWIGTKNGLFVLHDGGRLEAFDLTGVVSAQDLVDVSSIVADREGIVWVATESSGLFQILPNGSAKRYGIDDGLPGMSIASLFVDSKNRLWIGMRAGRQIGLARWSPPSASGERVPDRVFTEQDGMATWVPSLHEASEGLIWVGTTAGLCSIDNEDRVSCNGYKSANNLCDYNVTSIAEDRDANLWLASRCGIKKWSRYGFTSYFQPDGLPSPFVNSIFENSSGELFVSDGSQRRPLSRFDGKKFISASPEFPPDVGFGWGWKQTVLQDSENAWWYPTANGLHKFPGPLAFENLAKTKPTKVPLGGRYPEIFRIYEDSRKDIWVATWASPKELWRWERTSDRWVNHTAETVLPAQLIDFTAFAEDRSGNLWIGTGSDYSTTLLFRYRDGRFERFSGSDNNLIAGWLKDIYVDRSGALWIASTTSGLLRLRDVNAQELEFDQYTMADGLSSNGIYCVTEDEYGRIYAGSARGIDRLEPNTGRVENFTTSDGLPRSYVEIAFRDRSGNLWFGTSEGLARFNPEPTRVRKPPKIFISGLRAAGAPRAVSLLGESELPTFDLAASEQQVTIDFFGLGADLGEKLKFEYRLSGSDWIPTLERSVNFGSLSPGAHTFEVRAVTADALASEPATVAFNIASPIWQRPGFILVAVLVVAALAYSVYRYRLNKHLVVERTRTRIATDLHDDIGANLSKISLLSEIVGMQLTNGNAESKRMLATIGEVSRSTVDSMRDIVWSINPSRDSVLEMTRKMREHAEDACVPRNILVNFVAPDESHDSKLPMELRRELFLIFKEAVNNAVRHSACSVLSIELAISSSEILLVVADDGRGFDPGESQSGNGLTNIRNRVLELAGTSNIKSAIGSGTTVSVRIPA